MNVNGNTLLRLAPIRYMRINKVTEHGVSYGLGEAGYDIRIKQAVTFRRSMEGTQLVQVFQDKDNWEIGLGRFVLASAMEEFDMPTNLTGIVHDKSTWARRGLSVFNTVIEPGWQGHLTLELVYHGNDELIIPAGSGIAQVIFHLNTDAAQYEGKYQNQIDEPVPAKVSEEA